MSTVSVDSRLDAGWRRDDVAGRRSGRWRHALRRLLHQIFFASLVLVREAEEGRIFLFRVMFLKHFSWIICKFLKRALLFFFYFALFTFFSLSLSISLSLLRQQMNLKAKIKTAVEAEFLNKSRRGV